jgi:hypothetical protein
MRTHSGSVGKILKDVGKITFDTLEKFKINYDEMHFGKPEADFYIDDLAVNCFSNIEKEMGFYQTKIDPRSYNFIETSCINTFIKKTNDNLLDGEIYWYSNIPNEIKDLFPIMFRQDPNNKWYEMEKIIGIPVSKIYLSNELTTDLLLYILESLNRIYKLQIKDNNNINIYLNYTNKIKIRYADHDYKNYKNSELIYKKIINYFEQYDSKNNGVMTLIHGDRCIKLDIS